MACDKYRTPCNLCDYAMAQDKCPGVNFWNRICDLPEVKESEILTKPVKKNFGKLFSKLQEFLPDLNFQSLSSNRVSLLKRDEAIMLLKNIRHKNKDLVPQDYVTLNNDSIKKMLYKIMITIYENRK